MASVFFLGLVILLALPILGCCWHNPHGDHICEDHYYERTEVEECLYHVLAGCKREDWHEIIIFFKNRILPFAGHAWNGNVDGAAWAFKDTILKQEVASFVVKNIVPHLNLVDPETADLLDDIVDSKSFRLILSITGMSTDLARIRVSLAEGKYYEAFFYVGSKVALTLAGVVGLHPHFYDTYKAFRKGDYWGAAARLVALPLPIAKQLLWLLPLPIFTHPFIGAALDIGHSFIVDFLGDPSFLKPLRYYTYKFVTDVLLNDEVWRMAFRVTGYVVKTLLGAPIRLIGY